MSSVTLLDTYNSQGIPPCADRDGCDRSLALETTSTHQYANFQDRLPRQVYFSRQIPFRSISELIRLETAPFAEKDFNARYSDCGA